MAPIAHRARFYLGEDPEAPLLTIDGWTTGETWNGFACPLIRHADMPRLAAALTEIDGMEGSDRARRDTPSRWPPSVTRISGRITRRPFRVSRI